jgi:hypothetical protein
MSPTAMPAMMAMTIPAMTMTVMPATMTVSPSPGHRLDRCAFDTDIQYGYRRSLSFSNAETEHYGRKTSGKD